MYMITDLDHAAESAGSDLDGGFDEALRTGGCLLELATGERLGLPAGRWHGAPTACDELLLGPCRGPSLDVGCGPGRLAAELAARGVDALGIDTSALAVRMARARGASALRRDVFGDVPRVGSWRHVLLADGNVGIGGDPVTLLRRVAELAASGVSVLVEVEPPGTGVQCTKARVGPTGGWFPWARVGADAVAAVARSAGLRAASVRDSGGRYVATLVSSEGC